MTEDSNAKPCETCSTCACFARMMPDGSIVATADRSDGQPVCRRGTPGARYVPADEPLHLNGQVMLDKHGTVRTRAVQKLQIGYPPVSPEGVCWDGWRPIGTRPGERYSAGI